MIDDELLTVAEAAERLGRKAVTIRSLVARGKLTPYPIDGRTYMIRASEIDKRLEDRHNDTPNPATETTDRPAGKTTTDRDS